MTSPVSPEPSCRLVLKSGEMLEVNLSASRVKFLRREKKPLALAGPKGKKILLDLKHIEQIIPLTV